MRVHVQDEDQWTVIITRARQDGSLGEQMTALLSLSLSLSLSLLSLSLSLSLSLALSLSLSLLMFFGHPQGLPSAPRNYVSLASI